MLAENTPTNANRQAIDCRHAKQHKGALRQVAAQHDHITGTDLVTTRQVDYATAPRATHDALLATLLVETDRI
jgi:hypothetical protein